MASVYRNGNRWRASVVMPDGRRITKTFDTKADATAWGRHRETEADFGTWQPAVNRRLTLGEYAERWADAQTWRASTRDNMRRHLEHHIVPEFGGRRVGTISNSDVGRWVRRKLDAGAAATSVDRYVQTLSAIMNAAVADGVIQRNPVTVRRIRIPKTRKPLEVMTAQQVHALADAVPGHLRAFVLVGAAAGLRPGEIAGLGPDAVDGDTLHVTRQLSTTRAGIEVGPPKTESSRRDIPMPQLLVDELAAHQVTHRGCTVDDEPLLFARPNGDPWTRGSLSDVWRAAAGPLGIHPAHRGWHALRHFYASALIAGGATVTTVQSLLGTLRRPRRSIRTRTFGLTPTLVLGTRSARRSSVPDRKYVVARIFPSMKADEALRLLKKVGYTVERQKGSHRKLVCEGRSPILFAFHKGADVPPGAVRKMLQDSAGLTDEELNDLL